MTNDTTARVGQRVVGEVGGARIEGTVVAVETERGEQVIYLNRDTMTCNCGATRDHGHFLYGFQVKETKS